MGLRGGLTLSFILVEGGVPLSVCPAQRMAWRMLRTCLLLLFFFLKENKLIPVLRLDVLCMPEAQLYKADGGR